jgi:predicted GIY-YIG superfamily endonuclease
LASQPDGLRRLSSDPSARAYGRRAETSAKEDSAMKYVYLLQSLTFPDQRYIGITEDVDARLQTHNAGGSPHTAKYRPWKLETYICFQDDRRAIEFERYLKSGSGRAFSKKRL